MQYAYEDLFDIERRPGAGLRLWGSALERQLQRVREVNYRHRLHYSPRASEQRDDPGAEGELHSEVYFLVLTVRRVVLFHEALARLVEDQRLRAARERFDRAAPGAIELRNFYEHLDEYLLDRPRKYVPIPGRAAPVLVCRWDSDNVIVAFGPRRIDVTLAAVAAIDLAKAGEVVWDEHLERRKAEEVTEELPDTDDGVARRLEVTLGVSTIIEGEEEDPRVHTGTLLDVQVREVTSGEIGLQERDDASPNPLCGTCEEP